MAKKRDFSEWSKTELVREIKKIEKRKLEEIKPKYIFTCPICNKNSIVGITAKLVKDHDHKSGKAREWICDSCNTGLGRFKDDIALLEKSNRIPKKIFLTIF